MVVLNKNTKRETGRRAQKSNISAAVNVASIVRSTLGPKAMLKMLLDPMGGIVGGISTQEAQAVYFFLPRRENSSRGGGKIFSLRGRNK